MRGSGPGGPSIIAALAGACVLSLCACATPARSPPRRWIEDAVLYGVVPRSFSSEGAAGITRRLDGLRALGVDAIYLSPINATIDGNFGYAVTDYLALRPDFGGPADFHSLIGEAHRRGMRVLMDFVPNHTSDQHPWFRHAQAHGRDSPWFDFYDRDPSGAPTHYFDWSDLPNLNYGDARVRQTIEDAFSYWVREFDVDGFRVDAAWGLRDRAPAFFPSLRQALQRIKPDLALIAEGPAGDPYFARSGFDAAYDWGAQLGHWAWEDVFADGPLDAPRLVARLDAALSHDPGGGVLRFLDNNDTGARFASRHGVALTRVAAALLLTLPGVPLVYMGDEIGADYVPYDPPRTIDWGGSWSGGWNGGGTGAGALREHYRRLIALRHQLPALRSRRWQALPPRPGSSVYAYLRTPDPGCGSDDAEPVLVLLDFGAAEVASLVLPAPFRGAGALFDVLEQSVLHPARAGDASRIPMTDHGVRVLALRALAATVKRANATCAAWWPIGERVP